MAKLYHGSTLLINDDNNVKTSGNQSISGIKTMTSAYLKVGTEGENTTGTLVGGTGNIELFSHTTSSNGGVIDFHYAGSTDDYTSRIIENTSGGLSINGNSFSKTSPCTVYTAPTEDTTSSVQIDTVGARNTKLANYQLSSTAVTHTASTAVGSASQPVYIASTGVATAISYKFWVGTQSAYNGITTKDSNTLYFIKES